MTLKSRNDLLLTLHLIPVKCHFYIKYYWLSFFFLFAFFNISVMYYEGLMCSFISTLVDIKGNCDHLIMYSQEDYTKVDTFTCHKTS